MSVMAHAQAGEPIRESAIPSAPVSASLDPAQSFSLGDQVMEDTSQVPDNPQKSELGSRVALSTSMHLVESVDQISGWGPPNSYLWGVTGSNRGNLADERRIGINAKMVRVSWRDYMRTESSSDAAYIKNKRAEIDQLRRLGFQIIVDLGLHDTPVWLHKDYADSYYVDQYGQQYVGDSTIDNGDANLVFNRTLRSLAETYIQQVFTDLGTGFAAVRMGAGHWGELTYPSDRYGGRSNCYWAFDANAKATSPTPGWIPGSLSPSKESNRFLNWYLNELVDFQNWQIASVRKNYGGPIMVLYPSWGIRSGQVEEAIAGNLAGKTSAEINGEVQRGYDFQRQIGAVIDPGVVVTTTWLDADNSGDSSADPRRWSPVKYLSTLASKHPLALRLFGENTGRGTAALMERAASQMRQYRLIGLTWYSEDELYTGRWATISDYQRIIASTVR
jgi:hypothetical protein